MNVCLQPIGIHTHFDVAAAAVVQNSKLLRAIESTTSVYQVKGMQRDAMQHAQHSRRLSKYRGPEATRYLPVSVSQVGPLQQRKGVLEGDVSRPGSARPADSANNRSKQQRVFAPMQ